MAATTIRRSGAAFIAMLQLFLAPASVGQEKPSEPEGASLAIPTPEVAGRADALSRQLRLVRERIAPVAEIEAIAAALEERTVTLATERADTLSELDGQPTLANLAELTRDWSRHAIELSDWRSGLTRRAAALETEVNQLKTTDSIWEMTLEGAASDETPSEVLEVIGHSIAQLAEARKAASRRRSQVLSLQNRVSQQELVVAESLEAVQQARAALRDRLFEPDEPPIWSAMLGEERPLAENLTSAFASSRATVQEFLEERQARLLTLAILFVLVWLAAVGLKSSITARRAAGAEIAESSRVFRRPFAIAALIALLSVFWLLPLAPEALLDIVGLLLLIPMLRLLPSLMHPGFRPILYGVAVFYVVDRLRDVLEGAPLEGRVAFAFECGAAALLCLALLRPGRLARIPDPDRFPRWPGRVLRLGFAAFSASFLANLLGYVSLAKLLGEGVLVSIYIAIGLYAGVRVAGIILDVTTKTAWAQEIRFLRARRSVAVDWIRWGISVLASGLWVYWTLEAFAVQDAAIGGVRAVLTASLSVGTASISLGDLVAFGVTVAASIAIARIVRFVLMEDLFSRIRTARGVPHAVSATAHYVILFGGFLLAVAAAGIDFNKFTLLAGAFGVGIGFGLQNVVNNFISGIILLYERPIQVGDTIDMGDLIGRVKRIGIRSSTVRTYTGSEVIVPNGDLISQRVINWTLSDKTRRIDVPIGVSYGTDPEQVIQILVSVGEAHERVLGYPPPEALFRAHGDSSLDFELRAWIANFDEWFQVESELNTAINRALTEARIEIPFPQRDLHLRSVDPNAGERLARQDTE